MKTGKFSDIRADGTIKGRTIETYINYVEWAEICNDDDGCPFLFLGLDAGGVDEEVRIAISDIQDMIAAREQPNESPRE